MIQIKTHIKWSVTLTLLHLTALFIGCAPANNNTAKHTPSPLGVAVIDEPHVTLLDKTTSNNLTQHLAQESPRPASKASDNPSLREASKASDNPSLREASKASDEAISTHRSQNKIPLAPGSNGSPSLSPLTSRPTQNTSDNPSLPEASDPPFASPLLDTPEKRDRKISIDLGHADLVQVIKMVSDLTGINFSWTDDLAGTVSVVSPTQIPLGDLYDFLETLLALKGYAAIPAGNLVKIIKRDDALKHNIPIRIGADPEHIPLSDRLVTQIMPLRFASADDVASILLPRLPPSAHLIAHPRTNKIIITARSSNIHHAAQIIQQLDVPDAKTDTIIRRITHASASVIAQQITQIMQNDANLPGRPARSGQSLQFPSGLKIQADRRTNSLIITANPADTLTILDLIDRLDVQKPDDTENIHVVPLKNASAVDMAASLSKALENLKSTADDVNNHPVITPDEDTNALIITASPHDFALISKIIDQLDIVRVQILVEMQIIEISEDDLQEIGIDWATFDQAVAGSVRAFAATNFGPRIDAITGSIRGLNVGAFKTIDGEVTIGSVLQALRDHQSINILSTPSITTMNHKTAQIIVAENIPFVENSRITETADLITPTVVKTFTYRDVGVILKITPHVSQVGRVQLEVDAEFSKVIEGAPGQSVDTPSTSKRSAKTVLTMDSGSTVVIGGLIRDDKVTLVKQIPLLGDLPIIGGLFKWTRSQTQKTNLLIFITPYVLDTQDQMDQIAAEKKRQLENAKLDL